MSRIKDGITQKGELPAAASWRSLDELAGTREFQEFTAKEFPGFANVYEGIGEVEFGSEAEAEASQLSRRQFVALSAAALGLAGLSGCRRPDLQILPYSQTPDAVVPGVPLYYATSLLMPGGAFPVLVESHEGRPTKIEGHPKHPASLGASSAQVQASILDLYSPDRSKTVLRRHAETGALVAKTWEEFDSFAASHFAELRRNEGEGLRFLIENQPSPALRVMREQMKEKLPKAVWHCYEPIDDANGLAGNQLAFGLKTAKADPKEEEPSAGLCAQYNFRKAMRIVSLDCDFLGLEANAVANSRGFAELRRDPHIRHLYKARGKDGKKIPDGKEAAAEHNLASEMSRLYVLENTYTVTGTLADHRLRIPAAHIADYALALAQEVAASKTAKVAEALRVALESGPTTSANIPAEWIREVAADLVAFEGRSLVVAGSRQPPIVHALAAFINEVLGNTGNTVEYRPAAVNDCAGIGQLTTAIGQGQVKTLVIVGGNPVYNAPADLNFADTLVGVPTVIRLGLFQDETSEKATWHLPLAHSLEAWGDAETPDGTYSIVQPLIAPLHGGRSLLEFLILASGYENAYGPADAKTKVFPLLQKSFAKRTGKEDDLSFKRFIQEGFVPDSQRKPLKPRLHEQALGDALRAYKSAETISAANYEVSFHADYSLFDGRFAWNGWLMEFPDPITKLVWDNAALISPRTAEVLQVTQGDILEIEVGSAKVKVPAFIQPGQADASISLQLGYGKLRQGHIAEGGGFDVYPIRTTQGLYFTTAKVTKTGERYELVTTQEHGTIPKDKDRDIIQDYAVGDYEKRMRATAHQSEKGHKEVEHETSGHHEGNPKSRYQWGYDSSAYKTAGKEMRDIKRIALATAEDVSFPQRLDGHMQWGMVIDLNTCSGCSACVIACQSENNIPIVGKGEVKRNREMHWISLHRYFMTKKDEVTGGLESPPAEDPRIVSQPMMCQHCEAAPCESVCPVNAAVHSPEGLNLQVYNRCIGTRYCSNNCPYKARRFNWFDFNKRRIDELRVPTPFSEAGTPETLKMQKNPEVTVRMRGVMEKCTYCIQRIEKAKIGAKVLAIKAGADRIDAVAPADPYKAGYDILVYESASRIIVPDGIIHTACAQACPTGSIVFGNVRDERSRVHQLKNVPGGPDYLVLGDLNTKPRTSYLPRLRNVNPNMLPKENA